METFFQLKPSYIAFYMITALWIGEFMIFPSKYESDDFSEKTSFKSILLAISSSIALTVVLGYLDIFYIESSLGKAMQYLGIAIYTIGIVLRYSGAIYLGEYFTRDVQVSKDLELVSDGPYRILRHPLYLGLFLLSVGVPMFFRNPVALIFTVGCVGTLINQRMILEEESMEATIGERYREWKRSRYRFIPFIY
jgi:protein-S-isoprenylcysteine O-methyltransferase Ste14